MLVCQVAYDWLGQDSQSHNLTQKGDLFIQIWESKIQAHLEQQKVGDSFDDYRYVVVLGLSLLILILIQFSLDPCEI